MKHVRHSTLIRIVVYGGAVVIATSVWAWALGFPMWHGAIIGGALGLTTGIFLDRAMRVLWEPERPVLFGLPRYWRSRMSC